MDKEKKTHLPSISNEDFNQLVLNIVKMVAKDDVNVIDQIESLMMAMIACAAAGKVGPNHLFLFTSKTIFAISSLAKAQTKKMKKNGKTKEKEAEPDYEVLFDRMPNNPLKN